MCAICVDGSGNAANGGTHETNRLCRLCLADPINAGWNGKSWPLADRALAESATLHWTKVVTIPAYEMTDLERKILGLMYRNVRVRSRVRVRHHGRRVWQWGSVAHRPLTFREIAFLADCKISQVRKMYEYLTRR